MRDERYAAASWRESDGAPAASRKFLCFSGDPLTRPLLEQQHRSGMRLPRDSAQSSRAGFHCCWAWACVAELGLWMSAQQ